MTIIAEAQEEVVVQGTRILRSALIVLSAVIYLVAPLTDAQAQNNVGDAGQSPRTPWGDPDLQGIWNNATITPLQRPESLGDQAFLTAEEVAATEQRAAEGFSQANATQEVRTEPLPVGGDVGAYNSFWTEESTLQTGRTSLISDPPNGRLPRLTAEAEARITSPGYRRLADVRDGRVPADGPEEMGLSERCLWYRGIGHISPTFYNNNYHFFQTPDAVVILQEHIHDVRYIFLDGRPHLPSSIRQFAGDSRGRWDGETLVVETRTVREPFIRRWLLPQNSLGRGDLSEQVVLIERFTRTGPDTLNYEFTVNDPGTWVEPWTGSLPMARTDGPMFEFACHEKNYGLMNIMAGSRAEDAR
jgi:hypothetical protein